LRAGESSGNLKLMPNPTTQPQIDVNRYRGQWLALHPATNRVVAHDRSLRQVKRAAAARGVSRPVLYCVPRSDGFFVGSA
jgi:hypothetical protein